MREIPEILDDLRAAYNEAHAVTTRFGRLAQDGNLNAANRIAKDLRTSHAEVLRLLKEAVDAMDISHQLDTESDEFKKKHETFQRRAGNHSTGDQFHDNYERHRENSLARLMLVSLAATGAAVFVIMKLAGLFGEL